MGKIPVRMKSVTYALSPFQQKVMPGLWKDLSGKISHKISENWISTTLLLGPLVGTYSTASYQISHVKEGYDTMLIGRTSSFCGNPSCSWLGMIGMSLGLVAMRTSMKAPDDTMLIVSRQGSTARELGDQIQAARGGL
ncbi:hypothetical protein SASPL_120244 [Salvia splendens]|uniref:Uncharacterized protein n=1 Tax=Salvia splendens TaxID=180675 RepID=A0A8X8ZVF4_SALSN|nr:hypothetical protein SASPL_120244 [Salvia splendens]